MTAIEFLRTYEAASAAHDLAGTLDLVDEEAVYFFSNESTHVGKAAVRQAIQANFDAIRLEQFELRNIECLLETTAAVVCLFDYHWSGEINGEVCSGSGRGTSVLRRDGDSWKVVHEHLSRGSFRSF